MTQNTFYCLQGRNAMLCQSGDSAIGVLEPVWINITIGPWELRGIFLFGFVDGFCWNVMPTELVKRWMVDILNPHHWCYLLGEIVDVEILTWNYSNHTCIECSKCIQKRTYNYNSQIDPVGPCYALFQFGESFPAVFTILPKKTIKL